jgi:hypothetical protein
MLCSLVSPPAAATAILLGTGAAAVGTFTRHISDAIIMTMEMDLLSVQAVV